MPRNERLRQLRLERQWRQQDVADQLGIALVTIQRWERGFQQPSAYYRVKLSALFGLSAQELGVLEAPPSPTPAESGAREIASPGAAPSGEIALWTVPYARNPHFTGRDDLLEQLMQQFSPQGTGQSTSLHRAALTQARAIKGLGGVGKTQIAVEYAYRAYEQGRYTHTIWINAGSPEAILTSLVALAEFLPTLASESEKDQRKLVAALIRWLEACPQTWLLIVDNADDLSMVQPYLPTRGNGHILLTTRANAVGALAPSIEVDCMGLMEGTQLLLRRAQREGSATADEIDEATNIVVALAQFPLALDQAGAYIEETGCSLHDYFQLYQQQRYALLARRGKQTTRYPESVATTWSLSFQYVEQTNPAACELLGLCAFLAPDSIPQELPIEGAAHWPPALRQAVADPLAFNQMLEALLAFSLVKRLAESQQLAIHRLVQVVQRERLTPEEQGRWAQRVVRAVHAAFPRDPQEMASWPQCGRYLEQVQACEQLIGQYQLLLPEAAEVLDRAGTYLCARAVYSLAEPLYRQAIRIWEQLGTPESLGRAHSLNNLARLSFWQDKPTQAESLYLQALSIREQQLGSEHLLVAASLHDLAGLYRMQGKYPEAESFYRRALSIREQQLGPEHLEVAASLNGLAGLYRQQGRYTQAEPLSQRALSIREQQLGLEHLDVAESLNDLATLYGSMQGKQVEVEQLCLRALHIWEQQLGPENLMVTYPLLQLALIYRERGEYGQAEPLYLRALSIREQQLGPDHRNLAYPLSGLAEVYRRQGNYGQAEPLYLRALSIREQQLGEAHPLLAFTLDGLAHLASMQAKFAKAEVLYQRALRIREEQLGQEHSDVALSLKGLANLYTRQGQYTEAEPLYLRALCIVEQQLGPEHTETANILYDFAGFQHAQGRTQEAARLYQRALVIREHALGADCPVTIGTSERLHNVLVELRRTQETARTEG